MLPVVQVPEHGDTVFTTRRRKGSVGRDGEGVDVAGVAVVVRLELALVELPDLRAPARREASDVVSASLYGGRTG